MMTKRSRFARSGLISAVAVGRCCFTREEIRVVWDGSISKKIEKESLGKENANSEICPSNFS